jgi:uncharacterized membrane protein
VSRPFKVLGFLLVVAGLAYALSVDSSLPDPVPSHWDANGQVNGTMPKPWGVLIVPIVMAILWAVFLVLPRVSPKGFEMGSFSTAWGILTVSILAFMLFVEVLTLSAARTAAPLPPGPVFIGIGLLFAVIGVALGKTTRNFFAGIRTPWTLASEEVWKRTHRLASKLFVAVGLIVVATGFIKLSWWVMIAAIAFGVLVPVVYSYVIYRRLEGLPTRSS